MKNKNYYYSSSVLNTYHVQDDIQKSSHGLWDVTLAINYEVVTFIFPVLLGNS